MKFQHVKPGKGPAFVRTTIKNVLSGKIVDKTFNAGMKMEFETVDEPQSSSTPTRTVTTSCSWT